MHIAMLPLMLALMLRRRAEYSHGHHLHTIQPEEEYAGAMADAG